MSVFACVGGSYVLILVLSMTFGQHASLSDLFTKPYAALYMAIIATISWSSERRSWLKYADSTAETMLGPLGEIGEAK